MSADPFDMMRQSVLAIQTQNELAAARVQIAALRKELAEAQENYHIVNEAAAKVRAQNEEIHADYEALANEHTKLTERHKALRASSFVTAVPSEEYEKLKAEVERLQLELNRIRCDYVEKSQNEVSAMIVQSWNTETGESAYVVSLDDYQKMADFLNAKYNLQKAEVERLRKAGDAMAFCLCGGTTEDHNKRCALEWLAAKEGKPSDA